MKVNIIKAEKALGVDESSFLKFKMKKKMDVYKAVMGKKQVKLHHLLKWGLK